MPGRTEEAGAKLCFDAYEVDPRAGELRKHGLRVPLEDRPFSALLLLLRHPNEVVTRDELQRELWPSNVFVDFDHGLNKAIGKIRGALNDRAANPHFIETVGRRGYRFIGVVRPTVPTQSPPPAGDGGAASQLTHSGDPLTGTTKETELTTTIPAARSGSTYRRLHVVAAGACLLAVAAIAILVQSRGAHGLRFWGSNASAQIQSLAVLPLENLSGDPGQEYFSDGLTDELITDLSRIKSLRVASRTSVMHLKGTRKTMPEIAQELNVDAVVEGSVSRVGNQVRIRTQLIRAASDEHLWAKSYTAEARNILSVQMEMAQEIAGEIRGHLSPDEQRLVAEANLPQNPEAYEAYLKGRYYLNQFNSESVKRSCDYFEQAVNADPAFAPGYTGLANCYNLSAAMGPALPREAMPKARSMANKALALDDNLAEAHEALGVVLLNYEWDWPGAYNELQKAVDLDPNSSMAHVHLGYYYRTVGRIDDAIRELKLGQQLDPVSPFAHRGLGWLYIFAGRYPEAEDELKKCLELDPHFPATRRYLVRAYDQDGNFAQAESEMEADLREYGYHDLAAQLDHIYRSSGYKKAQRYYFESWIRIGRAPAYDLATWHALLGQKEKALDYLELSYQLRENHMNKLKVNSYFSSVRSDPRYQQLLKTLRLAD